MWTEGASGIFSLFHLLKQELKPICVTLQGIFPHSTQKLLGFFSRLRTMVTLNAGSRHARNGCIFLPFLACGSTLTGALNPIKAQISQPAWKSFQQDHSENILMLIHISLSIDNELPQWLSSDQEGHLGHTSNCDTHNDYWDCKNHSDSNWPLISNRERDFPALRCNQVVCTHECSAYGQSHSF